LYHPKAKSSTALELFVGFQTPLEVQLIVPFWRSNGIIGLYFLEVYGQPPCSIFGGLWATPCNTYLSMRPCMVFCMAYNYPYILGMYPSTTHKSQPQDAYIPLCKTIGTTPRPIGSWPMYFCPYNFCNYWINPLFTRKGPWMPTTTKPRAEETIWPQN
jgi:hypothetical protein